MSETYMCYESLSFSEQQDHCLFLDYYDGPVSGVVNCPHCTTYYGFDMLDWTADHQYRLFMLYKIDAIDYERFRELATGIKHEISVESQGYKLLKKIVHPKPNPDWLVVWDNVNDLLFATLPVPNDDTDDAFATWSDSLTDRDWFLSLNIATPR